MLKKLIKKIIGKNILLTYHWLLAKLAVFLYNNPSKDLIVIGVTGTNGKTATVNFISQYLEHLEKKTGFISTVNFKIADKEWLNNKKMTMLGRFQTQKLLKQMVKAACQYAIVETSSQGIAQFRHIGINYDVVVFTNLTPEHIEAHGGFANYRAAKEKLFQHLVNSKTKAINKNKIIISNSDDEETARLKKFKSDKFITFGFENPADLQGQELKLNNGKVEFKLNNKEIKNNLFGKFNGHNILAALAVIKALEFDLDQIVDCKLKPVPGRQEWIKTGRDFKVMIDYAPEPASLEKLYKNLKEFEHNKLIHVLGSAGGGRDKARQPILGKLAGQNSDVVIITNEDPYDDDPQEIINKVAQGAIEVGKELDKNLFKILDRRQAIQKALNLAQTNDLVLITGKGAEQFICVANNKKIPWDDRKVVRELLAK